VDERRTGTSTDADVAARKVALRASAAAARRALDRPTRAEASTAVVARLLELSSLRRARTVLLYAATRDEVDLAHLIDPLSRRGARTLFPRVRDDGLDLVATADLRTLQLGYRGIREPVGPRIGPEAVEVVVAPGLAFDPHGGRIGQGGGHYDRLLATLPETTLRIGVCFACQVVPQVPRAAHDQPVDLVVTERAIYRTGARVDGDGGGDVAGH
jgi:5-formyltetrahydrofolate cyclo-ligase